MNVGDSTKGFVKDVIDSSNERKKAIVDMLKEFAAGDTARAKEVDALKADANKLVKEFVAEGEVRAKEVDALKADANKLVKEFVAESEVRTGYIKDFLSEVDTDIRAARKAWEAFFSAKIEKGASVEKKAASKAVSKATPEQVVKPKEELSGADLDEKILRLIKSNPKGIKVREMAEYIDISVLQLGSIAHKLLLAGKVRKDGKLYFPLKK